MKKVLLIIAILTFTLAVNAQTHFGLKAGLNIANLNGSDAGNSDSRTGFLAGGFFAYDFSPMFSIQPEVLYTMKGAQQKENYLGQSVTYTLKLDYVEIPVLLKLNIPLAPGSTVKPSIFAGPAIDFKVNSQVEAESGGQTASADLEDIKGTDFGLVFGGALAFDLSGYDLGFDVRYTLGLTSIDDSGNDADIKNSAISIAAFFGFR